MFEDDELCENCDYYYGVVLVPDKNQEEILVCLGCKADIENGEN